MSINDLTRISWTIVFSDVDSIFAEEKEHSLTINCSNLTGHWEEHERKKKNHMKKYYELVIENEMKWDGKWIYSHPGIEDFFPSRMKATELQSRTIWNVLNADPQRQDIQMIVPDNE